MNDSQFAVLVSVLTGMLWAVLGALLMWGWLSGPKECKFTFWYANVKHEWVTQCKVEGL